MPYSIKLQAPVERQAANFDLIYPEHGVVG